MPIPLGFVSILNPDPGKPAEPYPSFTKFTVGYGDCDWVCCVAFATRAVASDGNIETTMTMAINTERTLSVMLLLATITPNSSSRLDTKKRMVAHSRQ